MWILDNVCTSEIFNTYKWCLFLDYTIIFKISLPAQPKLKQLLFTEKSLKRCFKDFWCKTQIIIWLISKNNKYLFKGYNSPTQHKYVFFAELRLNMLQINLHQYRYVAETQLNIISLSTYIIYSSFNFPSKEALWFYDLYQEIY